MTPFDWTRFLDPPLGAIILGGLAGVANFAVIGYFWTCCRQVRLKERLVERGFSAAEIVRIIHAAPRKRFGRREEPEKPWPVPSTR